jgi:hypothetical protein
MACSVRNLRRSDRERLINELKALYLLLSWKPVDQDPLDRGLVIRRDCDGGDGFSDHDPEKRTIAPITQPCSRDLHNASW